MCIRDSLKGTAHITFVEQALFLVLNKHFQIRDFFYSGVYLHMFSLQILLKQLIRFTCCSLLFITATYPVIAEEHRTVLHNLSSFSKLISGQSIAKARSSARIQEIDPIQLAFRVRGLGRVQVELKKEWLPRWSRTISRKNGIHETSHRPWLLRGNYVVKTRRKRRAKKRAQSKPCLLYTSPSPRDATLSRMPSSA